MDIKRLVSHSLIGLFNELGLTQRAPQVNTHARAQQLDADCWAHHPHTLPPVSAILPDHAYPGQSTSYHQSHFFVLSHLLIQLIGHHYPIPPQGEGNVYYQQVYQQQPPPPTHQSYFQPPPQQQSYQGPPPSYQQSPTDLPYSFANPQARASSSTVSSTRYAPSVTSSSGPQTSAERRSLSDGEDDADSSDENLSGGSNTPLPPYYANQHTQQPQQVCFADGTVTPPSDRSGSEPDSSAASEYVCDVCNVSYSRAPDLRRHKASVHNDRDSREKVYVHRLPYAHHMPLTSIPFLPQFRNIPLRSLRPNPPLLTRLPRAHAPTLRRAPVRLRSALLRQSLPRLRHPRQTSPHALRRTQVRVRFLREEVQEEG